MKILPDQVFYVILGVLAVIGMVIAVLIKTNLISFSRKSKPKNTNAPTLCPEHNVLVSEIRYMKESLDHMQEDQQKLFESVDHIGKDVSYMKGLLEGRSDG